ncbi:hypothetical protein [Methanolobus profundi]|uniref:Uncharacterized protein n=1 Tax=Methanolobus profundi TaxID=487685 RepID=A0A1I4SSR4_9EURY|nr:hypothetical protein [Methanolobus profundi]SFM67419.1 hypothetical protein SAMN04488696_1991 [Methanolobus profundi]
MWQLHMKKDDDSAQMILIASFAIGLSIVVLTLMLNNIIYASNTASESNIETNVFEFSNAIHLTSHAYEKAYEDADNGSFDQARFNDYMNSFSTKMAESSAFSGTIYILETGTFMEPYFTKNGLVDGRDDWTVIERVNHTDTFLMAINTSLTANQSDRFVIEAVDTSGTIWSASFFRSGSNVNVTVTDGVTVLNTQNSSSGELNITSDLMDGSTPFQYYFNNRTTGKTYSLLIKNGDLATGTTLISGDKINGKGFKIERIDVIEASIRMNKDGKLKANVVIPVLLPKGTA